MHDNTVVVNAARGSRQRTTGLLMLSTTLNVKIADILARSNQRFVRAEKRRRQCQI